VGRRLAEVEIRPRNSCVGGYERDPAATAKWKTTVYRKLKARANRRKAKIFFLDEARVRSDQVLGQTWGIKGQTPEGSTSAQRQSVNAISAGSERGEFWWASYRRVNTTLFLELLKLFMKRHKSPVLLIPDGHPTHKARAVAG
jgi:hypothetical protein